MSTKINPKCRFCNYALSKIFVDLGKTPLANSFLNAEMLNVAEPIFPLRAYLCDNCLLVQLEEFESPNKIFKNYAYFSSFSETWLKHSKNYVTMAIEKFVLDENSLVIEIASNDGYLLQYFKQKKIPILGIEPAENIAKVANEKGIPTLVKFFNVDIAKGLAQKNKKADLIIGNNVLAHVPDINDFVDGLRILLKSSGVVTMEFPHLLELIKQNQFDTIYHEHFFYYSFLIVKKIFEYHNLQIFDVEKLPTHGGSLRIYATHKDNKKIKLSDRVSSLIIEEKQNGIDNVYSYGEFSKKVDKIKKDLIHFCTSAKNDGKKIVGYGAAAKGNTLLNYCGITLDLVDFVVDRSPHKQNLFLPGTHIPIKPPEEIRSEKPDFLLILPWNLKDEIMIQMSFIRDWGGKFVIPIPELKILS